MSEQDKRLAQEFLAEVSDSLYDFCRYILGFDLLVREVHQPVCDFVQGRRLEHEKNLRSRKLVLMPRDSFKSTIITVGYTIMRLVLNPNIRILIASENFANSKRYLKQVREQFEQNDTLRAIYGNMVNSKDWREDYITVRGRTKSLKEPSVTCAGLDVVKVGMHYDLIICDDLVSQANITSKDQMDKVIDFYKLAICLFDTGNTSTTDTQMAVIGCLVAGSQVTMSDGTTKAIEKVKVGEKVVSKGSIEKVEAMIPQGKAKVFELKTQHHTIRATANHPFLTRDGFKKLEDLKIGDKIFAQGYKRGTTSKYSKDDLWLLGFMLGDGWITENPNKKGSMRYVVCFAKGVDETLNEKVLGLLNRKSKGGYKLTKGGYYRLDSNPVAKYLLDLGFNGKAKTKRIPKYVFNLKDSLRESFIEGFIAADGWIIESGQKAIELCNRKLIKDLKQLCEISGYRVSNIFERTRVTQPPNSPEPVISKTAHISIGKVKKKDKLKIETIHSIEEKGEEDVYDLTVSNTHNFVANGLVVHNTRWHFNDLYNHLAQNERHVFNFFKRSSYNEDGSLWFPQRLTKQVLDDRKKSLGSSFFSCQYLNEPVDAEDSRFKKEWIGCYDPKDIEDKKLNTYITLDPAIAQEKGSDYSAIITVGVDTDNIKYVLNYRRVKAQPYELIDMLIDEGIRYKPEAIGIEEAVFAKMLSYLMNQKMAERGVYFRIVPIKPNWTKSKDMRIMSLQPIFEYRQIKILPEHTELTDELLRFPKGAHDDVIDALAYQVDMWQVPAEEAQKRPYYKTFGWWMDLAKDKPPNISVGKYIPKDEYASTN